MRRGTSLEPGSHPADLAKETCWIHVCAQYMFVDVRTDEWGKEVTFERIGTGYKNKH